MRSITGFGLLILGVGLIVSAVLGPLALGVIVFRVSDNMENQLIGGEIVSLFVAAPVALLAGLLWLRWHPLAPALAIAPALYALYMYVQYILASDYTRYEGNNEYFFPFYLVLIILSWTITARAWVALGAQNLPTPRNSVRLTLAVLLIMLGAIFALAWSTSIATVLTGETVPEYQEHPTLFWLIRLVDLAFIIPIAFVTGVGLLRNAPWAVRIGHAFAGFQTLLVGAVAAMAAVMAARGDPSADPALLVATAALTLALVVVYTLLLLNMLAKRNVGARSVH